MVTVEIIMLGKQREAVVVVSVERAVMDNVVRLS